MYTLLPVIIFLVSYIFWFIYGGACKKPKMDMRSRGDRAFATTIIVLFLFYPTVVSALAQSMNCIDVDGERRLAKDFEEICFQGTHWYMFIFVSLPGLVILAAGIPLLAGFSLKKNWAVL